MSYNDLLEYDNLIKKIAHKFYGISFDDLYQAGFIGLMKAKNNYQNNKNVLFSTYAYKYIFGEMYYLVLSLNSFKVNKNILKLKNLINKTKEELTQIKKKEITDQELLEVLNISYDDYLMASLLDNSLSLDYESDFDGNIYDYVKDKSFIEEEKRLMIKEGLEKLDPKSQELIIKRYFYDYSQEELAAYFNMSQTSVSRYEKRLINQLNKYVA